MVVNKLLLRVARAVEVMFHVQTHGSIFVHVYSFGGRMVILIVSPPGA